MALDALKGFIDNTLSNVFHRPQHDPVKARTPVLKGIERTEQQFGTVPPSKAPNKWWKVSNGIVAFSPKLGSHPLLINGEATNYIPSEQFPKFLATFKSEVEAGSFDKEIEAHGQGDAKVGVPRAAAKGTRTFSEESKLNIRVGGFRRGGKSDADIKKLLEGEGIAADKIKAALAKKPAAK